MFGIEGVLDFDGDILDTDGIDSRGIDNLGTEVTQLHSLNIRQLIDGVSRLDDLRVGSHEAIDVSPDLQHVGIEDGSNDRGSVVTSATSQIGGLVAVAVTGNKARNDVDLVCCD